jgi:hypothetical protein
MINKKQKDAFWTVVEKCLLEFHHIPETKAHTKTQALRTRIEQAPRSVSPSALYHAEPFDVACDIANQELDLSKYWPQYEAILKQYSGPIQDSV